MPDSEDLEAIDDAVVTAASQPANVSIDGNSVSQQSADDQLKRSAHAHQQGITVNQLFGHRTQLIPGPRQ
jgi:hypothetical protein